MNSFRLDMLICLLLMIQAAPGVCETSVSTHHQDHLQGTLDFSPGYDRLQTPRAVPRYSHFTLQRKTHAA